MKTTTHETGLKVKASVKAGTLSGTNHNGGGGLRVRAAVKAGFLTVLNHSRAALTV